MKKSILILFFISYNLLAQSDTSYSPTAKGRKMISCKFSVSNRTYSRIDSTRSSKTSDPTINIGLEFGYFVAKNLVVGISSSVSYFENNELYSYLNPNNINSPYINKFNRKSLNFGLGMFGNYYIDISKRIKIFVEANASLSLGTTTNKSTINQQNKPTISENITAISASISPGIAFFISKKVAFEINIGNLFFSSSNGKRNNVVFENENRNTNYGFDFNRFTFGLSYFF